MERCRNRIFPQNFRTISKVPFFFSFVVGYFLLYFTENGSFDDWFIAPNPGYLGFVIPGLLLTTDLVLDYTIQKGLFERYVLKNSSRKPKNNEEVNFYHCTGEFYSPCCLLSREQALFHVNSCSVHATDIYIMGGMQTPPEHTCQ